MSTEIVVYEGKKNSQTQKKKKQNTRKPKKVVTEVVVAQKSSNSKPTKRVRRTGTPSFQQYQKKSSKAANSQLARFNRDHDAFINNLITEPRFAYNDDGIFDHYIQSLVKNWMFSSRYPDSEPRKTALFTSVSSFNVPLHLESNGEYRFSLAVQPQMGDLASPDHYQAAIASTTTDFALTDWSQSTSYVSAVNGRDPRLDINTDAMTASVPTSFHGRTQLSAAGAALAQGGIGSTANQNFQGPNIAQTPTYSQDLPVGSLAIVQNLDGSITVPAGSYQITAVASFTVANAAGLTNVYPIFASTVPSTTVVTTVIASCTTAAANTAATATHIWSVVCNQPTRFYFTILKTNTSTVIAAGDLSALVTDVFFNPTNFTTPGPSAGAISLIRPVNQTILVTYMGPVLLNGGRIAGAYVPRGSLDTNYFTPAANIQGNYQMVENLANLSGAYDGKLKDGTFGFWSPYDKSDTDFQTLAQMNASTWPAMVVSGVFNPVQSVSGNVSDIVRVRLITTFEFITKSTAFNQMICSGSQNIIDRANRCLARAPRFIANAEHENWIQRFLQGVLKYGPTALKVAETAAMFL